MANRDNARRGTARTISSWARRWNHPLPSWDFCRPTYFCSMDTGIQESGCLMLNRRWVKAQLTRFLGNPCAF